MVASKNISADIASDFLYQMEILKCYDIIYEKLKHNKKDPQLKAIGELYRVKIMFWFNVDIMKRIIVSVYKQISEKNFQLKILLSIFKMLLKEKFIDY